MGAQRPRRQHAGWTHPLSPRRALATPLLLLLLLAACVEPPTEPLGAPERVQVDDLELPAVAADSRERRAQEVTVRVRSLGCTQFGLGSGFLLPGGVVVTNRHVIEQPREVTISTWDGRSLPVRVAGVATDSDLALLDLAQEAELPVAELRTDPVDAGEQVLVAGYPGGGAVQLTPGEVLGFVDGTVLGEPSEVMRINVEVTQGSSGGPVLDSDGRVVGVIFAIEVDARVALAVPVDILLQRLDTEVLEAPDGC